MFGRLLRWLVGIAIAAVIVAGLSVLLRPAPLAVDVAVVDHGTLSIDVEEQGRTRARHRYTIAAPVTGRLLRTGFEAGDRVERGNTLVHIAPPPENSRTEATARANLAVAEARQHEAGALLEEAQGSYRRSLREAERRAELSKRGLVSHETRDLYEQTADAARARVASARASLAAAQAEVESARARLLGISGDPGDNGMVSVKAPVGGRVLRVYERSERVIQAGSPLFELSDGGALELVIDLLTEDAVQVRPGADIVITGWGGDDALHGKVRYIEPGAFTKVSSLGVEEQRVNVIGDLLDAPASLGVEYRIEAAIVTWTGDNVLKIPTSALFRSRDAWRAFVVEAGIARLRVIEVGRRGTEHAEVITGVTEGERVIVFPSDLVEDGVRVTMRP